MIEVSERPRAGYFVYYRLKEGSRETGGGLREDYALALDGEAIYPQLLFRALLSKVIALRPREVRLVGEWGIDPAPFGFTETEGEWTAKGENLRLPPECAHE